MPLAPAISSANLATTSPFGLYLGPQNVRAYTPIDSITVTEEGPGAVSSMSFVVEDPTGVIALPVAGSEVRMMDLVLDYPIFLGFLNDWTAEPYGIGRIISVNAIGIETILDWSVVPSTAIGSLGIPRVLTFGTAPVVNELAQTGAWAGLQAPPSDGAIDGSAASPIGRLAVPGLDWQIDYDGPFFAGPSDLRSAIDFAMRTARPGGSSQTPLDALVTVDFYRRLRVFRRGFAPADYTNLTVSNTSGSSLNSEIKYEVHPADAVRSVYVIGGNAAGTGFVYDGSGIQGKSDTLDAPASLSVILRDKIGEQYLDANSGQVRGTLTLSDYVPTVGTIHPSSTITITDVQVSLSAQAYQIASITKTFPGGTLQNWEIAFGSARPSFIATNSRERSIDIDWTNLQSGGIRS